MIHKKDEERGFILVTSLILLSILTILGAVSFYKSNIEIKVSASSIEMEQAYAAMNVGLGKTYADWAAAPTGEFQTLGDWVGSKTGSAPAIYINSYPSTVANLGGTPPAGARIYTLGAIGVPATGTAWGTGTDPQVAIWVTSFKPQTGSAYPYSTPTHVTATACSDCALVVYALGRSGDALRLGREYMSSTTRIVKVFGAMVNAPKYKTLAGRCGGTDGALWGGGATTTSTWHTHMIDSTQAPGGVAMASNNSIKITSKDKPYPNSGGTSLKGIDPYVVYDPGKVLKADYPKISGNYMSSILATVVSADRQGTNKINYFNSANDQLFQLGAYREAANRIAGFATETIDGTSVNTSGTKLGNYTPLKNGNPNVANGHARMGTIQWPDLVYNIQNQVPMYGIVRLMIPMTDSGSDASSTCPGVHKFNTTYGDMPLGRLIVYGAALFDFFNDANNNDKYEPNLGESLLTPNQALLADKINVNTHISFNPAMDGNVPRTTGTTLTMDAAGLEILEISTYPLGSPSWDVASDVPAASDGAMDTMSNIWNVGTNWGGQVYNGTGYTFNNFTSGNWALTTDQETLLDYYIRTTSNASRSVWSEKKLLDIETNKLTFNIDTRHDLVTTKNSSADIFHSFLPSAYIHGWKRAFQVTGLAADPTAGTLNDNETIWSEDLLPVGSPYHAARHDYFFVTKNKGATPADDKVYVDKDFSDIPAQMYAGGLVDMHQHVNTSGVVYTPGQLELELKSSPTNAQQFINGVVITGAGVFMKDETSGAGRAIIAYDDTSIDKLPGKSTSITTGRKYWQELK